MMPTIRIDQDIYDYLNERGKTVDTFNDVLRRELGVEPKPVQKRPSQVGSSEVSAEGKLREVLDAHLPSHWVGTRAREEEIRMVIVEFLRLPGTWTTKDREIAARKSVAERLGIDPTTVSDKYTRQLYGEGGGQVRRFRDALERIEQDFKTE